MSKEGVPNLQKRVYDMVAAYVYRKSEDRSAIPWESIKDQLKTQGNHQVQQYREAREKVCKGAFLAVRSRKSREEFTTFLPARSARFHSFCHRTSTMPLPERY